MLSVEWIFVFLLLGSVVGFIAGLLGVGGGGILVPVLSFVFLLKGVSNEHVVHLALGTSMACIITTSIASLRAHHMKGAVNWEVVKAMSIGIIIGTLTSTYVASYLNSNYLAVLFSLFMGYTAIKMLKTKNEHFNRRMLSITNMFVSSLGIGAISALVSIGGGALTVPYLVKNNVNMKKAIGTSAAIGLPISVTGTFGYIMNGMSHDLGVSHSIGFIYLPAVFLISLSSFVTAFYGAKVSNYLPVHILKKLFAILLVTLSLKMMLLVIEV